MRLASRGAGWCNVQFRGFDIDAVMLPDDPSLWLISDYPRVIRKAVVALQGRDDKAGSFLLFYLTDQLRGIDSGHPIGLLNRDDFVTYGGEELAALAESVIRRLSTIAQTRHNFLYSLTPLDSASRPWTDRGPAAAEAPLTYESLIGLAAAY